MGGPAAHSITILEVSPHWARHLPIVVAAALLCACGGPDETPVAYESISRESIGYPLDAVDPSSLPANDDTRTHFYTFRTQAEWDSWSQRAKNRCDPRPLPSVDLAGSTVAGVFLGWRSNACYTLTVQEVVDLDGVIVVRYHEGKPGAGDTCPPVVVHPLKLIKIQATGLPVEFEAV